MKVSFISNLYDHNPHARKLYDVESVDDIFICNCCGGYLNKEVNNGISVSVNNTPKSDDNRIWTETVVLDDGTKLNIEHVI